MIRIKVNKEKFVLWFVKNMVNKLSPEIQSNIIQKAYSIPDLYWLCKYFPLLLLAENQDKLRDKLSFTKRFEPKKSDRIEISPDSEYFFIER